MNQTISHNRRDETSEAKARWFQSLSLSERMDLFLSNNPRILDKKNAQPIEGRIRVLSKT